MTGLDVLIADGFSVLAGRRVGLVTHPAAVASDLRSATRAFAEAGNCTLAALFGPEHGLAGTAQDLEPVAGAAVHPRYHVPVYSLYGDTFASLKPTPAMLAGLDVLVIDLQDVGSRYYTFQATMLYCLEACGALGLPVVVLDRPNPVSRLGVEGPTVAAGFESFVGPHPVCTLHGLTMGELARLYRAERTPGVDLTVIPVRGSADFTWNWLPPSPNMPTRDTAAVYPGMCLIEGTNASEGRGTTRPFETIGFPGADADDLADRLNADAGRLGCRFLPAAFTPTFQKHARKLCSGVFLVPDAGFRPVRTGLAILCALRDVLGDGFEWRTDPYEFVSDIPAIDLLFGSDRERLATDAGGAWDDIAAAWEPEEAEFAERRRAHLLYE